MLNIHHIEKTAEMSTLSDGQQARTSTINLEIVPKRLM